MSSVTPAYTSKTICNVKLVQCMSVCPIYSSGSRGQGVRTPPLLGQDVGFLTLCPKLDPLLDPPPFLLVDLRWTPVADPGRVCVTGVITPTPLECG